MASLLTVLFLLSGLSATNQAQQNDSRRINLGSSLNPTIYPTSWLSPSGQFAFGFYQQGNGFAVGIWMVGKHNITVVWIANPGDSPVAETSLLALTKDGKLLLRTEEGRETLIASNTEAASFASVLDSGNFVLYNKDHDIVWESFNYPTDTILGGQILFSGTELISRQSETNYSTGRFHMKMQDDGNLVLYPLNTGDFPGDAYWNTDTFGDGFKFHLSLNNSGLLQIINGSYSNAILGLFDPSEVKNDVGSHNHTVYRATLDADGVFRLYSHSFDENGEFKVKTEWEALKNPCGVNSFCGFNSFCTFNDNQPYCLCLPGSDFINPNQKSLGCSRNYSEAGCKGGKENGYRYGISQMQNMEWGDRPYIELQLSVEECSNSCLEDCNCGAALFDGAICKKQDLPLRYVKRIQSGDQQQDNPTTAFLKVGNANIDSKNKTMMVPLSPIVIVVRSQKALVEVFLLTSGLLIFSCIALVVTGLFVHRFRVLRYKRLLQNGNYGLKEELTLQLFSYNELKRATNGFKEELGKGSFGAVYKGTLYRGKKVVAVKRLEKLVEEGEKEFRSEMRSIGRTHHRNLVQLLGFCAVDSKRLLVYEYMSNGSLADLLFKSPRRPDWNERVRIALDVARGVLYLHEECESTIIHCDIKPQNILMDEFWTAKISDFGLAKLLMPDQTRTFTGVRGTRGYLAPEWQTNAPISVKADVYSYGILLLEIVCCRKNMEITASEAEEIILSTWAYKCFAARELDKLVIGEQVDKSNLEKMVKVGLWCIQDEPALRPSMKSVVVMLEGIGDVLIPPCPVDASRYSSSILLHCP